MIVVALGIAALLAFNIGANNTAAEMSPAYGAGVRTKRQALFLIALFVVLGAIFSGQHVIKTLGRGIVPEATLQGNIWLVILILGVTTLAIFAANRFAVPIATTHAAVCAVAAVGAFYGNLQTANFFRVVVWWLVTPGVALILSFFTGRYVYPRVLSWLTGRPSEETVRKWLGVFVTLSGCFVAYSAGSNNAANSVGILVGYGVVEPVEAAALAGVMMAVGAIAMGGRVLDTVGKGITELCAVRAVFVELTASAIILTASHSGIPVSLTEITTMSLLGLGCAQQGVRFTAKLGNVRRIAAFWVASPLLSFSLSFLALHMLPIR